MLRKQFYIGHTKISIYDDCCVKTPEERDAILERIGDLMIKYAREKALKELEAKELEAKENEANC